MKFPFVDALKLKVLNVKIATEDARTVDSVTKRETIFNGEAENKKKNPARARTPRRIEAERSE